MKKLFILIIAVFSTLFVSCEAEKEYITKDSSNQKLEIWKFPVGSVLKHKPELKNRIEKFKSKDNLAKKTSAIYNFSIEETEAQVIFKQEYTQYTFVVERENPSENILENYICKVYNDGQILQYLITYPVIENETETIYDGQNSTIQIIQDETIAVNIFGRGIRPGCTLELLSESWNYTCTNIACGGAGHDYGDDRCDCGITHDCTPASQECGWVGTFTYGCSSGNGNSNGNTNPGNNGGGSSGGGGSTNTTNPPTNPNPNDDLITVPLPGKDKIEIKLLNSFSTEQLNWWNNVADEEIKEDILAYVKNYLNLEQEEAIAFAKEAIDALRNGGEVDIDKEILYLINKPCQNQVVKDVLSMSSLLTNLINETFGANNKVNVKFSNIDIPNANAYTNPFYYGTTSNFTISIAFDNTFLDTSTDLGIVAVTLHELVHAQLLQLYIKGQLTSANSTQYNDLLNAFIAFYDNQVQDTFDVLDNEIHNAMEDFIEKIGNSLYNYANSKNIDVTLQYCIDLAWGTMSGYELFNEILTSSQQINCNNIFAYEQDNLPQAKGNPCN